ncbi:hypothetical protein [Blastococcus sp. SYSU DS0619]|jgi:hypothetical protein
MIAQTEIDDRHHGEDVPEGSRWADRANVAFWGLLFGTVVMIAADESLRAQVAEVAGDNPFSSDAALLTVLRVATFGFALLFALLQAWIYGLLLGAVTATRRPRLVTGWGYVLVAQAPLVLLVGGAYLLGGTDAVADVQSLAVRLLLGVVSVAVYAYLAARRSQVEMPRLLAFGVLAAGVNTALLLLSAQR